MRRLWQQKAKQALAELARQEAQFQETMTVSSRDLVEFICRRTNLDDFPPPPHKPVQLVLRAKKKCLKVPVKHVPNKFPGKSEGNIREKDRREGRIRRRRRKNEHMCVDVSLGHRAERGKHEEEQSMPSGGRNTDKEHSRDQNARLSREWAEEPTSDTRTFSTTIGMGRTRPQMMEGTGRKNFQHKQRNSAQAHLSKQGSCTQVGLEAEDMRKGSKRVSLQFQQQDVQWHGIVKHKGLEGEERR